jgi:hypothetical protein
LRLTTATEELEQGRQMFRCRLESAWSFLSKALFFLICIAVAVPIVLVRETTHWIWFLLLVPPLAIWVIEDAREQLKQQTAALLDEAARLRDAVRVTRNP